MAVRLIRPRAAEKIATMAGDDARSTTTWTRCWPTRGSGRRLRLHTQRRPSRPGRAAAQRGQARRGREAAGDHPAAVRRDHRGLRRRRRPALHDLPVAVHAGQLALKEAIDGGRFGRLTLGDTYVKWWRTQEYYDSGGWRGTWQLDGGGALMNQAIHNVDLLHWLMGDVETIVARRPTWPTSGSRSRTRPSPSSASRTAHWA